MPPTTDAASPRRYADGIPVLVHVNSNEADVDGTFADLTAAGAPADTAPRTEPWGERVASVRDPDGNVVHIGAPSAPQA